MNQAPIVNPVEPAIEIKPEKITKIKNIIITIVVLLIIVLSLIIGLRYYNNKKTAERIANDKTAIENIFTLRSQATEFYEKNRSYKDWQPNASIVSSTQNIGVNIVFRKSDYQNYIMYAYISSHAKYFCIDTTGFADEVNQISNTQVKCN